MVGGSGRAGVVGEAVSSGASPLVVTSEGSVAGRIVVSTSGDVVSTTFKVTGCCTSGVAGASSGGASVDSMCVASDAVSLLLSSTLLLGLDSKVESFLSALPSVSPVNTHTLKTKRNKSSLLTDPIFGPSCLSS